MISQYGISVMCCGMHDIINRNSAEAMARTRTMNCCRGLEKSDNVAAMLVYWEIQDVLEGCCKVGTEK